MRNSLLLWPVVYLWLISNPTPIREISIDIRDRIVSISDHQKEENSQDSILAGTTEEIIRKLRTWESGEKLMEKVFQAAENLCKNRWEFKQACIDDKLWVDELELYGRIPILAQELCPEYFFPEWIRDEADCHTLIEKYLLQRMFEHLEQKQIVILRDIKKEIDIFFWRTEK